jgi:LuxR family quorum sensing-dependent transcriptional regulator
MQIGRGKQELSLFAFLDDLKRLPNADAVADTVLGYVRRYGLETLLIGTNPIIREPYADVILVKRMPEEWIRTYAANQYAEIDPVVREMKRTWKPFEWREVAYDPERDPRAERLMQRRREFGFGGGFVVPIHGAKGFAGFVSMSGRTLDLNDRDKPALQLIVYYAFHHVISLRKGNGRANATLSAREREVLTWVASGKSAWEIGEILNIAKRTVDEHAQAAFQKLGAINRAHAVAIAIRDGLIEP